MCIVLTETEHNKDYPNQPNGHNKFKITLTVTAYTENTIIL